MSKPRLSSLTLSISWLIESKALERSRNAAVTKLYLSVYFLMNSVAYIIACIVDLSFLETILMFAGKATNLQIIVNLISHKGFNYFRQTGGNWYWSIVIRFFKDTFFEKRYYMGFFRHLRKIPLCSCSHCSLDDE